MAQKKLTPTQQRVWKSIQDAFINQVPGVHYSHCKGAFNLTAKMELYAGYGSGINPATLRGIAAAGYIKFVDPPNVRQASFKLTQQGLDSLPDDDAQPTEAQPEAAAVVKVDARYVKIKPGVSILHPEIEQARDAGFIFRIVPGSSMGMVSVPHLGGYATFECFDEDELECIDTDALTTEAPELGSVDNRPNSPEAAAQWTDAELSLYDPDEPIAPYRPGATADDERRNYAFEVTALKKRLAEMEQERADRLAYARKLEEALEPFAQIYRDYQIFLQQPGAANKVRDIVDYIIEASWGDKTKPVDCRFFEKLDAEYKAAYEALEGEPAVDRGGLRRWISG